METENEDVDVDDIPEHDEYTRPGIVPEEWSNEVSSLIQSRRSIDNMTDDEKIFILGRFVVATKYGNCQGSLTWNAVYLLSRLALDFPNLEECYDRANDERKAGEVLNSRKETIIDAYRSIMPVMSANYVTFLLENAKFKLEWKPKIEHLKRLAFIASASEVTLRIVLMIDYEIRMRTKRTDTKLTLASERGWKYMTFMYNTKDGVTRGRWMPVGYACPFCNDSHPPILVCVKCGNDAAGCSNCSKTHCKCYK